MWILQKMREMPLCIRVDQSCTTRFNSSPNPSQKKPNNPTSDCPNKKETRNTHRAISASPPPSPLHGHTAGTDEKTYHWICFECVCILSLPDAVATGCTGGSSPLVPPTHTASAARAGALKGAPLSVSRFRIRSLPASQRASEGLRRTLWPDDHSLLALPFLQETLDATKKKKKPSPKQVSIGDYTHVP